MKKKVLLKSAAAVMSVFTLAPCFGNVAFAMKKNEGPVVTKQVANEKEIAKNEIIKLVNTFGDKTLEIIENEPERLSEVKGLTKARANKISEESFILFIFRF